MKSISAIWWAALVVLFQPDIAFARNIVLTNDDGLTSNVRALYNALKAEGHDVIVSLPCSGQSGMGAAIKFARPLGPLKENCLNDAARVGDPGAGPMTREGFEADFFYVDGTPVMALLYALDVVAPTRWGKRPEIVLSGPNEGQNVGAMVITSGTVSNAQFAAISGYPAIAFSAGADTADNDKLANPKSAQVAQLAAQLVAYLDERAGDDPLLPPGVVLNVNFPDNLEGARWRPSRLGTYSSMTSAFTDSLAKSASPEMAAMARAHGHELPDMPGVTIIRNEAEPSEAQMQDEAVIYRKDIAVTVMQPSYENTPDAQRWLREYLDGLIEQ